jgi:predicted phage terminase large subunit-like protein
MALDITPEEFAAIISEDQLAFTEEVFAQVSPADKFQDNWSVGCMIEHLRAVELGQIPRLVINVPPRELKSITVTIAWPAWLMGKNASSRIIAASYGDALAKRHSLDTRLVMESDIYKMAFPNTRLALDQNEKGMFMTTKRGFRKATSVGGQVLGDGGDYLIADDLLKADEAPSDTVRESTNAWLDQSFLTRFNDSVTGKAVMVAQRLHMDDPCGHVLERGGWHHLILPAVFTKKTIIEINGQKWVKEEGDLLNEVRLPKHVLDQKMKDLGPGAFSGQFMQTPTPEGGGDFKPHWLQHYNHMSGSFSAHGMNCYILVDPANSKKKHSNHDPDFTVMFVVGLANDNNYYVLDILRDRLNPKERIQSLIAIHKKWNQKSGRPPKVGYEQYGMMTDAFYLREAQKQLNYRFPLVELGGGLAKPERIKQLITPFEEGRVYLPKTLPYITINKERVDLVESFISEYESFPVGRHDDIMDAFARIMDDKLCAVFPKIAEPELLRAGQVSGQARTQDWRDF